MRHLAYIVIALFLTGASCTPLQRGAVPAECEAICFMRCTDEAGDTGVRWRSEPETPDAWDALGGEVVPALAGECPTPSVCRQVGGCADAVPTVDPRD